MNRRSGFTLIELVMIIVILGILAAVAIPSFLNLQVQAKDAAARGSLGGLRSGVAIWYAYQAASSGTGSYPSIVQLTATTNGVMANGIIPKNPYNNKNNIKAGTSAELDANYGWIYDDSTGQIWGATGESSGM